MGVAILVAVLLAIIVTTGLVILRRSEMADRNLYYDAEPLPELDGGVTT